MKQIIATIYLILLACAGQLAAQGSRIMLTQLERGPSIDGSRQGLIGLTNANGDQRYAFYVNVADTCVLTTPTDTGNAVVSIFVQKCATDSIWYIDWEGRSILLAPYGGAGSCDVDWLEISDNSCPDAITDSLYKYKYASIGARYVWPGSEMLVNDSSSAALVVIQGSRNARLAVRDLVNETWTMLDHGGSTPYFYFPEDADFVFSTASGTPQSPTAQTSHFSINASDSTIQMHEYPDTRRDTNTINNFLYTDNTGKIRSQSIDSISGGGNGIYGGSGSVADGTIATIDPAATFTFDVPLGSLFRVGDYANAINGIGLTVDENQVGMGNIFGAADYYGYFGSAGNYLRSPASDLNQLSNQTLWYINEGSTYRFVDTRTTKTGVEYQSASYGPDFTDSTLVHRRYVADMISDSLVSAGSGTVTSVGLSLPSIFSVSGSPVTTSGTLTGSLATQTANTVFAGPTSGGAAAPTFRALVAADINTLAFVQDGNSFGATAVLGTNDANTLSFETSGTTRATLNTTGVFNVTDSNAATNAIVEKLIAGVNSTGTASTGFGAGIGLYAESSTTDNQLQGRIETRWATATHASRTSEMDFSVVNSGSEVTAMTIEGNGDVGIGSTNPLIRFCNGSQPSDGDVVTGAGMGWSVSTAGNTYAVGFTNSSTSATSHGLMVESNATDNASRALSVAVGSGPTRVFSVNCDQKVGILDITPESELDVTGTTSTNHFIGQNLTPTIAVNTVGAGTGASASMTNAQSSDIAGRFSVTSGTGATTGLWATITFDDAFTVTPVVQVYSEDADASNLKHYVNVNTTSFELFINGGQSDGTAYDFNFIIIGGK